MASLHIFKIILVGESCVGKTSLILRFTSDKFYENPESTLKIDIKDVLVEINGTECLLKIHDTAGQETFWSLGKSFFRGADGVILVYDETNADSFQKLSGWIENVRKNCGEETLKIAAGNKVDEEDKIRVIESIVTKFEEEENLEVVRTSAKNGTNVDEVFFRLVKKIALSKGIVEPGTEPIVRVQEPPVNLLKAMDESRASFVKENRSRFIAKHSIRLKGLNIFPHHTQTLTSEANESDKGTGCWC